MSRLPSFGPRGEGWVVIQFVILGLIAVAGFVGGGGWVHETRFATTVVAAFLLLTGGVLALKGILDLSDALTPLPHPRDGASLVDTGSYALVRHPIYGGLVIGSAGWALFTASLAALLGAVVLLAFFRLKSAREEAWLIERYPSYPDYQSRTRRMIPFLY